MEEKKKKIQSFTDLDAWREAHKLVVKKNSLVLPINFGAQ